MFRFFKSIFFPLLVVLSTGLTLGEEKSRAISFSVTRFDPTDRPPPEYFVGNGKDRKQLLVPSTYIEGPVKATMREGGFIDFYEDDGDVPKVSVKISESQREDLLLVFVPDDDGYRILPINAPKTKLKGGDRLVVNATATDLAFQMGADTKPVLIQPGKTGLLAGPRSDKFESVPVVIKAKADEGWKAAGSETWPCDPRFRTFLFVYRTPKSNHLLFHSVAERLE